MSEEKNENALRYEKKKGKKKKEVDLVTNKGNREMSQAEWMYCTGKVGSISSPSQS